MNDTVPSDMAAGIFPIGNENTAFAEHFSGRSWLAPLNLEGVPVSNVTYEAGCRSDKHVHRGAWQLLICVEGRGWYQELGKPARPLNGGDVLYIAPDVPHWHGAAKDSRFSHIAMAVPSCASSEWLGAVTDEEYAQLG